ncbi:MAG TPA: hypothetical protein VMH22_07490 [bacterium]|nr:hypothetical protein [bacterium]
MPGRFRSNVDRLAAYEIKTDPERVKKTNEDMRKQSLARHADKQTALSVFELKAKEAIDPTGVPSPLYVAYLNYCREIWKKSNTYGGAVLKNETDAIIAKWKARKLDEDILKHLRFVLINVTE